MKRLVLAALLAGCVTDETVLDDPVGVVLTCDDAWFAGQPGAPCVLPEPCSRESPNDPLCCTDYAYCTEAGLVMDTVCAPECSCVDDTVCEFGARICEGGHCEPCPTPDLCPACPDGWGRLLRNGCESCQCAPPSQCELPGDFCLDQVSVCYAGACAEMCDAFTPGCCSNVCAAPGCVEPAPVACYTECPVELGCQSGLCATQSCACDGSRWDCDAICVDELNVTCVYP